MLKILKKISGLKSEHTNRNNHTQARVCLFTYLFIFMILLGKCRPIYQHFANKIQSGMFFL